MSEFPARAKLRLNSEFRFDFAEILDHKFGLGCVHEPTFYTSNLFILDRVVHQNMDLPDCPLFKEQSNQRAAKFSILTPPIAV